MDTSKRRAVKQRDDAGPRPSGGAGRDFEDRLRHLFDSIQLGFAECEAVRNATGAVVDWRFLSMNTAFRRLSGLPEGNIDALFASEMPAGLDPFFLDYAARVVDTQRVERLEQYNNTLERWYMATIHPVDGDRFAILYDDVTDRKHSEIALRASEERFRSISQIGVLGVYFFDDAGVVSEANDAYIDMMGCARAAVLAGHVCWQHLAAPGRPLERSREAMDEFQATGRIKPFENECVRKDGSTFWALVAARRVESTGEGVGFALDVTERKRADAAAVLEHELRQREELRRELVAAEEAERRRLAREVHDSFAQHLTALTLGTAQARRMLDARESAEERLKQLEELARSLMSDARHLALELRPPELDDVGLDSALHTYVEQWSARYGVTAEVAVIGAFDSSFPSETGTAVYRIAQEALTNVARHAGARQVSVLLERPDREVRLIIEDDGRGFDLDAVLSQATAEGRLGLAGMRERATLVGGTLEIESAPGQGTTVYARIPHDRRSTGQ